MVFDEIKRIISDLLNVDEDRLTEDTDIQNELSADSLDLYEILMSAEDAFNVKVETEDIEEIHTIGDTVRVIEKYLDRE